MIEDRLTKLIPIGYSYKFSCDECGLVYEAFANYPVGTGFTIFTETIHFYARLPEQLFDDLQSLLDGMKVYAPLDCWYQN